MAITTSPAGSTMITGQDIHTYRFLAIRSALAFEVKTGMKMSRISANAAAKSVLAQIPGVPSKGTKRGNLIQMDALLQAMLGETTPSDVLGKLDPPLKPAERTLFNKTSKAVIAASA